MTAPPTQRDVGFRRLNVAIAVTLGLTATGIAFLCVWVERHRADRVCAENPGLVGAFSDADWAWARGKQVTFEILNVRLMEKTPWGDRRWWVTAALRNGGKTGLEVARPSFDNTCIEFWNQGGSGGSSSDYVFESVFLGSGESLYASFHVYMTTNPKVTRVRMVHEETRGDGTPVYVAGPWMDPKTAKVLPPNTGGQGWTQRTRWTRGGRKGRF